MADDPAATIDARLADELDTARRSIEDLAVGLCLDAVVFDRHSATLQRFDQIAQTIGEIAGVLRRTGPVPDAIDAIRLDALRDRLIA